MFNLTSEKIAQELTFRFQRPVGTKKERKTIKRAKLLIADYVILKQCIYNDPELLQSIDVKIQMLVDVVGDARITAEDNVNFREHARKTFQELAL